MKLSRPLALTAIAALVLLSACATRPMGHHSDPALVRGIIDGLLAPISFVLSLFSDTIRMYAFPNMMATAGKVTVAEVEEIVPVGSFDPDHVHTPGIYVDRVIKK